MHGIGRGLGALCAPIRWFCGAIKLPRQLLLVALILPHFSVADVAWPGAEWVRVDPASLGLDQEAIEKLSGEIEAGQ